MLLLSLLISSSVALGSPLLSNGAQTPLSLTFSDASRLEEHLRIVPEGFNLDLDERRLVQFGAKEAPVWVTEREKIMARASGQKFIDVTDSAAQYDVAQHAWVSQVTAQPVQTYGSPNASDLVKPVLKTLSTAGPLENLQKFTSFRTRYYRSSSGRESQLWLLSKINEITATTAPASLKSRISVTEFEHSWGQNSIIAKIKGTSKSDVGAVVISAHQDSTNLLPFLAAPGADDDGSGTVTILESYRALLAANYTPVHDVEWHWYSAEEGGLLGSQAVVKQYVADKAKIHAQLQFDMTAFVKKGTREEIGIITDYTDAKLTDFVKSLIDEYLAIPWVNTLCGYACSDHASWTNAGYPGAFGIESSFDNSNKLIHSGNDRLDVEEFSFEHMLEFSKLGVAYIIELAGWSK